MTTLFFFMIYNFQAGSVRGHPSGVHIKRHKERERGRTPADICQTNPLWPLILCPLFLSLQFLLSGKKPWCLAEVQGDSTAH